MLNKIRIDKILVVEGRSDTVNLKRFYDVDTYETGGSSLNETDIERLTRLQAQRGLIVFTDPDFQGERVRKMIMAAIPEAQHAFLNREEAVPKHKGSLGVEHASFESLEKALSAVEGMSGPDEAASAIVQADLIRLGLILRSDSRRRREYLGQQLRIGYVNGKQLAKRLNLFGITLDKVVEAMRDFPEA